MKILEALKKGDLLKGEVLGFLDLISLKHFVSQKKFTLAVRVPVESKLRVSN